MKISREEEDELFRELWNLIEELEGIASKYPILYRFYLRVATPERIAKVKSKRPNFPKNPLEGFLK